MKRIIPLLSICLCTLSTNAQTEILEYFRSVLDDIKKDTIGLPELLGIGALRDFDPNVNTVPIDEMMRILSGEYSQIDTSNKTMLDAGNEAFEIGEYDQAIDYYSKALSAIKLPKQRKAYAAAAKKLAACYLNISDYKNATAYVLQALDADEAAKDTLGVIADEILLAQVKAKTFYYDDAISMLDAAMLKARGRSTMLERDANYHLAMVLLEANDKHRALDRMLRARTIDLSPLMLDNIIDDDVALAYMYFDKGDTLRCVKKMVEVSNYVMQNGMQAKTISSLVKLSRLMRMLGKYDAAEANLQLIDILAALVGMPLQDVAASTEELANIYAAKKEYGKAYSTLQKYRVLSDSLFDIEKNKEIKRLEVQFETAKKERALAKSEKERKEKELALALVESELLRANLEKSEKERKLIASENLVQANKLVIADREAKQKQAELQAELKSRQMLYAGILAVFIVALISLLYYYRQRYLKQLYHSEALTALKSQMTRHLTFNGLESIRYMVVYEPAKANNYLVRYASFLRKVLDNTDKPEITLQEEIEELKQYMELEKVRTGNSFDYEFNVGSDLDPASIVVPSLIMQPIIENSILHGFNNIDYTGHIKVHIHRNGGQIVCIVADNGKGRKMNKQMEPGRSSKGTKITKRRIELYNSAQNLDANFAIRDMKQGVEVTITLPVRLAA